MNLTLAIISALQLVTHTIAIIYIKLIKYKQCSFDQNLIGMLYLFELAYALSFTYSLLNYTFDEGFVEL